MTITPEQVADLQPGDVVEITDERWPGAVVRGPVRITEGGASYAVGEVGVAPTYLPGYREPYSAATRTLTVISRAPRPLYVNHPRTEPAPGDVVRGEDGNDRRMWVRADMDFGSPWYVLPSQIKACQRDDLPDRLRLLVDGETGEVVR